MFVPEVLFKYTPRLKYKNQEFCCPENVNIKWIYQKRQIKYSFAPLAISNPNYSRKANLNSFLSVNIKWVKKLEKKFQKIKNYRI